MSDTGETGIPTRTGGLPPCLYGHPCQYDEHTESCPCEDDTAPDLTWSRTGRPVRDVPTGDYL